MVGMWGFGDLGSWFWGSSQAMITTLKAITCFIV